jgi:hypothetical protein
MPNKAHCSFRWRVLFRADFAASARMLREVDLRELNSAAVSNPSPSPKAGGAYLGLPFPYGGPLF